MAQVTVTLPEEIERPELLLRKLLEAGRVGLNAHTPGAANALASSEKLPRDRGQLQRSFTGQDARVENNVVSAAIVVPPPASEYADVQDKGRRAGARRPPRAKIEAWVRRRRAEAVRELTEELRSRYKAAHPRAKRGKTPTKKDFEKQAVFLLARGVIRKMVRDGMPGKEFVAAEIKEIEADALRAVEQAIDDMLLREGFSS